MRRPPFRLAGPPAYAGAALVGQALEREMRRRAAARDAARTAMTKVTAAPIASTVKGLSSQVPVVPAQGLEHAGAISIDNVITVPVAALGRRIGWLDDEQERLPARAVVLVYDLDVPLLDCSGGGAAPGSGGRGRFRPTAGSGAGDGPGAHRT